MKRIRTKVVGVTFEGRQKLIRRHCRAGRALALVPEPKNPHDSNAVGVWVVQRSWFFLLTTRKKIGHLGRDLAADVSSHLRAGGSSRARILEVTGGKKGRSLGVNIEIELS